MPAVALPAGGAAAAAAAASTQAVALRALHTPGVRRLELTERADGALVLSVSFDGEGGGEGGGEEEEEE